MRVCGRVLWCQVLTSILQIIWCVCCGGCSSSASKPPTCGPPRVAQLGQFCECWLLTLHQAASLCSSRSQHVYSSRRTMYVCVVCAGPMSVRFALLDQPGCAQSIEALRLLLQALCVMFRVDLFITWHMRYLPACISASSVHCKMYYGVQHSKKRIAALQCHSLQVVFVLCLPQLYRQFCFCDSQKGCL